MKANGIKFLRSYTLTAHRNQRGEGEGNLLMYALVISVLWAAGWLVMSFFHDYKLERMEANKNRYADEQEERPYTGQRYYTVTFNK